MKSARAGVVMMALILAAGLAAAAEPGVRSYRDWLPAFPRVPASFLPGCMAAAMTNGSDLTVRRCPVKDAQLGYFVDHGSPVMMVVSEIPFSELDTESCRAAFESVLPELKAAVRTEDGPNVQFRWRQPDVSYELIFVKGSECTLLACKEGARRYPFSLKNPCLSQ